MNKRLIANIIGCACLTLATAAEALNLLRRSMESRLCYTTRKLRSDLQFLREHKRRRCDPSQSGEV